MTAVETFPIKMADAPGAMLRQRWISAFARCVADRLPPLLDAHAGKGGDFAILRAAEPGLVMIRARAGGSGTLFNAGEMTVTRCSVRAGDGTVGHGYVAGRDRARAEMAAKLDAIMQTLAPETAAAIVDELEAEIACRAAARQSRSAPTKVEFLTMVRGE